MDDDSADALLNRLLTQAGHDVVDPDQVGMRGQDDSVHLTFAISDDRTLRTGNHDDFAKLHNLVLASKGHHPGVLCVRRDNDPRRDLSARGIVRAIEKLLAAGVPIADEFIILNHWR